MSVFKHWGLPVLYTIGVQILLCLPGTAFPKEDWTSALHLDKWVHIFLFGMLCYVWCRYIQQSAGDSNHTGRYWLILAAVIANGIIMEFVQKFFIPFRSFDIWDIVADIAGAIIGFWWGTKIAHQKK